jgi:hypothetical protein
MRIDSSGNVGIGTSSPATQLDLAANNTAGTALNVLRFTDTDLSATGPQELGKIEFYSADNSAPGAGVKASITGIAEVGNPGGGIAFSTDLLTGTPIERMRIDRNGNVGIGTSSPATKLDVSGTVNATALSIGGTAITATAAELNFVDGVTSLIQTQLDAKAPSTSPTLSGATLGGTTTITGGTASWTWVASGTNLTFAYGGVNKFRIDSSGNLTVTGNVTAYGTIT